MRALRYVDDPLVLIRTDQGWLLGRVAVEVVRSRFERIYRCVGRGIVLLTPGIGAVIIG